MEGNNNKDMEEKILKAAEAVFLEKGYALASTTEIARRTGCNQTLVHYYFRTKEKLFESVFGRLVELFILSFHGVISQDLPFRKKLTNLIDTHFEFLYENQQIPFLILNELTTNPNRILKLKERFSPVVKEIFSHLSQDIEQAVKRGEIRTIAPFELLFSIASLNISVFLLRPVFNRIMNVENEQFQNLARKRKIENIEMILHSLTPLQEK